jgi:prepilin-type N-terminal cleavage/methylation domain-containing protein
MSNSREILRRSLLGFSLLEVMVALAILALSFTSLILVQSRSMRLAGEARNISIATQLARMQLFECKKKVEGNIAAASDFNEEGNFSDIGYEDFTWECHAPKFDMKTPSASAIDSGLKSQTPDSKKKELGAASAVSAPFISMITNSLGQSVRELAVIVRWKDYNVEDEVRVVTHVIDLDAMSALSRILSQGVSSFEKMLPGKNAKKSRAKAPNFIPPGQIQPPRGP